MELSTTWVNLAAEQQVTPRRAAAETSHSAVRLDDAYTPGVYSRRALPVDASTSSGTLALSAAPTTFRVPSTFVVTVRWTSRSARAGSRCAAKWKITSGWNSEMMGSSVARSLISAEIYSASGSRGHPSVIPRLMLTTRRGCNATSSLMSTDPTHPVPPVTATFLPPSHRASTSFGSANSRLRIARYRAYSAFAPSLGARSRWVSSRRSDTDCLSRRSWPSGTAPFIAATISWTASNFWSSQMEWSAIRELIVTLSEHFT